MPKNKKSSQSASMSQSQNYTSKSMQSKTSNSLSSGKYGQSKHSECPDCHK